MFVLSDRRKAEWSAQADDRFPDVRSVWLDEQSRLGELPKTGNALRVLCCGCWDVRFIGGQEICRRWPEWLVRPGVAWARALRCSCGAKRFCFMTEKDPKADGFQHSSQETAPIIFARRLSSWLQGGPIDVYELARHLADMPLASDMRAAGL